MDNDRRSGTPVLRPKLDRNQATGPSPGRLIGLAAGAAAAVAAVAVIVAASVPSIDLFGLYAGRKSTVSIQEPAPKRPAPSAPIPAAPAAPQPAPAYDPSTTDPEPAPAIEPKSSQSPPTTGTDDDNVPDPTETDPKSQTKPPAAGERSAERDAAYLRDLKPFAELPKLADSGETTLSYLHDAEKIRFDDVALLDGLAALGEGEQFRLVRDGKKSRWLIELATGVEATVKEPATDEAPEERSGGDESGGDESSGDESSGDESGGDESGGDESGGDESGGDESGGDESAGAKPIAATNATARPIADVWCLASSVMFQWRPEAKDAPAAEQLRNAVLRFTIGTHQQVLVLREPLVQPIHTLDLSDRSREVTAKIENPPRPETLYLEVLGAREMPVNAFYENELQSVAIPAAAPDAKEQQPKKPAKPKPNAANDPAKAGPPRVTILFDKQVDGEQPQIWVEPRLVAPGDVAIRFASRIVRGKIVDDLTAKSLELYRVPRDQRLASVERDWKNAHDLMVALDRRIGETRAGINPSASIANLRSKYLAAQKQHRKLDDELKRIKAELVWVDAAGLLVKSVDDHGQLEYRVFAKSGDVEVDLVCAGLE